MLNVVGLTPRAISPQSTPRIERFVREGKLATVGPVVPAVTCTVQSTYLTGVWPSEHGIVGNGWYDRAEGEVKFWKQSDKLVQRPRIWEIARQRDPSVTCANICWWYAMYSSCDYTVTPRPMYPADGRKLPDIWTHPPELRGWLQDEVGQFPLFNFWGPLTSIESTQWIAVAAIEVDRRFNPALTLVYLPHLDYVLQRGSDASGDLRGLDEVVGVLLDHFSDARVILLSEYGITPVSRPVHLNRVLRQRGLLTVREELGRELLDPGASQAFAVADHQIAHVYVKQPQRIREVHELLQATPGVGRVIDDVTRATLHLDHDRSGELIALAEPDAWFTYYYWMNDSKAPDFARTVDIHRKPGYDPVELFFDPRLRLPKLRVAAKLLKRKLGFRSLLNVIPLDATLVKGSHGLPPRDPQDGPLFATSRPDLLDRPHIEATDVFGLILEHLKAD